MFQWKLNQIVPPLPVPYSTSTERNFSRLGRLLTPATVFLDLDTSHIA